MTVLTPANRKIAAKFTPALIHTAFHNEFTSIINRESGIISGRTPKKYIPPPKIAAITASGSACLTSAQLKNSELATVKNKYIFSKS